MHNKNGTEKYRHFDKSAHHNHLADVIINLVLEMSAIVKPSTWVIFSGILLEQSQAVADALEKNGWVVATLWRRQEWCCLNVRRS